MQVQLTAQLRTLIFMIVLSLLGGLISNVALASASETTPPAGCTREWYFPLGVAAYTIGVDDISLQQDIDAGKSIADVASEKGIEKQVVIDALVDAESGLVHQMVEGGCLTNEEAENWINGLPEKMLQFVEEKTDIDDASQPLENVIYIPILLND